MPRYFVFIFILICLLWIGTVQGQETMRNHIALKGLADVQLVIRPSDEKKVMTIEEVLDAYKVNFRQRVPDLRVKEDSSNWLEFNYMIFPKAGLVELSLYRWVTINATGRKVFTKVWEDKRLITGGMERKALIEGLDILLISLGSDFLTANQKD